MEPFRILVDRAVYTLMPGIFDSSIKHKLWNIGNAYVTIGDTTQTVLNAIKIYTRSVFDAINDMDTSKIKFFEEKNYEL